MSDATSQVPATTAGRLPGAPVIGRIGRLLSVAVAAIVLYSLFTTAGKGGCSGGLDATGGYLNADGEPVSAPPACVSLTLHPSPLILMLIAGIVLWTLKRVLRDADTEASAVRIIHRSSMGIVVVAAASVVISQVWFGLIPLDGIGGTGTYVFPFPFGSVDLRTTP